MKHITQRVLCRSSVRTFSTAFSGDMARLYLKFFNAAAPAWANTVNVTQHALANRSSPKSILDIASGPGEPGCSLAKAYPEASVTLKFNFIQKQSLLKVRFESLPSRHAIYQFKKHLGKLPARLKEKAASSYETTGFLPDTVRVISAFKAAVSTTKSIRRLLGSQGLKRLSFQTPNVRLRPKRSNSVLVHVVLT